MRKIKATLLFLVTSLLLFNCDNEDKDESIFILPSGKSIIYDLGSKDVTGISGTATISENTDASVTILLDLSETPAGGVHPAHIHINTAAEGGSIALSLTSVNGDDGKSVTIVKSLDDGTAITYDELLNFDGYINVHLSASNLGTIVAQGDIGQNDLKGTGISYDLGEKAVPGISGNVTFSERLNGEVLAEIMLSGTPIGGEHPAHIHANTAAEGGGILLTFSPVIGDTGKSATNITSFDDGSAFTYADIISLDSYINVHLSVSNLSTIVAQGDIGQNDLKEIATTYDLGEKAVPGISGNVTFSERLNGEVLAEIILSGTPSGGEHPAHIHANTAAEGGGILLTFSPVIGDTGISATNITSFDDGSAFTYADITSLDSYINVHLSASSLSTIVAQGDIGQNDLKETATTYNLGEKEMPGISGNIKFSERLNGEVLAEIILSGTPSGGEHPAHIHANTAAEGGGILLTFSPVIGDTGISITNITSFDDGSSFTYADITSLDSYINVHLSASNLGTVVAQGDIGQNVLTGDSKVYTLAEKDVSSISGIATFYKRVNGTALAVLDIQNTPASGSHPAHIHENDSVTGGAIAFTFNVVDGDTGMSITQVETLSNGSATTYDELLTYDGYINVHLSATQLNIIVAQGNIGSNE